MTPTPGDDYPSATAVLVPFQCLPYPQRMLPLPTFHIPQRQLPPGSTAGAHVYEHEPWAVLISSLTDMQRVLRTAAAAAEEATPGATAAVAGAASGSGNGGGGSGSGGGGSGGSAAGPAAAMAAGELWACTARLGAFTRSLLSGELHTVARRMHAAYTRSLLLHIRADVDNCDMSARDHGPFFLPAGLTTAPRPGRSQPRVPAAAASTSKRGTHGASTISGGSREGSSTTSASSSPSARSPARLVDFEVDAKHEGMQLRLLRPRVLAAWAEALATDLWSQRRARNAGSSSSSGSGGGGGGGASSSGGGGGMPGDEATVRQLLREAEPFRYAFHNV